ncbi:MAG: D-amino-acid transaminase [Rhodospirillales bacterium]|nr:D-amino-acid transaminase [Rhodospirillales bacterium]
MPKVTYVNGRYLPHGQAAVHVEDRGFQFADGVYEVIAVANGTIVDEEAHLDRFDRSLSELRLDWPVYRRALGFIMREIIRRNTVRHGSIYLQATRGSAPRNHPFPDFSLPSLIVTAKSAKMLSYEAALEKNSVISQPDIRWRRCDIKSVSLLPNVLLKQAAVEADAAESWLIDDRGIVTEGTASNAWIVTDQDELITRHLDSSILAGITRQAILKLISQEGISFLEREFTLEEAKQAKEAFFTSTTALVKPAVKIDEVIIGDGQPGPLTRKILTYYMDYMDNIGGQ